MSQSLPYDEAKFEKDICIKKILNTSDESDIGYFVEVDFKYLDNIRQKTKYFPFCPENKTISKDIIMTEKNKEDFGNNNICRYCEEKEFY